MTHATEHDSFAHLTPAAALLGAVFARPKTIATACVVAFAALGWIWLGVIAAGPPGGDAMTFLAALCRSSANPAGAFADFALIFPMWAAMVLAMMLPSAGPMILTYAEIADTAARKGERIVSPFVLTAGYSAVWFGFALAAAVLQSVLTGFAWLDAGMAVSSGFVAGALFIGAGLYQFSALKQACLTQCRHPFPFFFMNWTTRARGVFRLGLRQGLHCLGCCWAMMLLMFAMGAMNVVWMAALGLLMTTEKMTTTQRFSRVLGGLFIAVGVAFVAGAAIGSLELRFG